MHAYLHLKKPFQRRGADALRPFAFEGIRPHLQAYAVEGWWLDNLLKGGKLTRHTYLTLAAQVTVGFQKRLGDCKAAKRILREESVQEAVHAAGQALAPTRLPMKVFPEVEAGVNLFR